VPVRIELDEVPENIQLVAGTTATVQIEPRQVRVDRGSSAVQ